MHPSNFRHFALFVVVLAIVAAPLGQAQDTSQPSDPKSPAASAPATAPTTPAPTKAIRGRVGGLDSLFNIVQVGMTHRGIRMPIMEDRKVTTIVTSEVMRRLDENNIEFQDAVIDQKGKDGMLMTLPKAVYNKQSDQLFSNQPSTVECPEYRIEGDTLSVDRKTNVYLMTGRVRFMFFGSSGLENKPDKAPAPTAPTPPPAPTK